jgi:plasmid stability protein
VELTITLPAELEPQVKAAAARNGRAVEDYVVDAVKTAMLKPSLDELPAPVREQFAASGMTEEEFDQLIEEERQAIWEEEHGKKA